MLCNVLVALNITRLDNWQLDPPTNMLITNGICLLREGKCFSYFLTLLANISKR